MKVCKFCGSEFENGSGSFCSRSCQGKWSASNWELDKELEQKMIKLEEENLEFYDRWFDEVFLRKHVMH